MAVVLTTWNLQGSHGLDVDEVVARVTASGTDVLLLQEVQRRQARAIARRLQARSRGWTFKHWPGHAASEGMAVMGVTRPAPLRRAVATTHRWRWWSYRRRIVQLASVRLASDGPVLRLVNVHLSPHDAGGQLRAGEVTWLLRRAAAMAPVAMVGDFNAGPAAAVLKQLRDAGLRDAWADRHGDDPAIGLTNWSGQPADIPPHQRIDYVWVSGEVAVKDATVPVHGQSGFEQLPLLSDHLPVTVTLDLG